MNKNFQWIVLLSLVLCACTPFSSKKKGQIKKSAKAEEPETPTVPPKFSKTACYFEESSLDENCVNTLSIDEISAPEDYNYRDPFTDPSFPVGFDPSQYVAPTHLIDLSSQDVNKQLTTHFKLEELMQEFKGKYALFSTDALYRIQNMRLELNQPILVTSGYRSPAYNGSIGDAASWSRHMYGDAIDFVVQDRNFNEVKDFCLAQGASFYQIYENHVHCDWRNQNLDESFYPPRLDPSSFLHIQTTAQENSRINVKEKKNRWILSLETDYVEDSPEELVYHWTVKSPNATKQYHRSKLRLKKNQGPYEIQLNVGGSLILDLSL